MVPDTCGRGGTVDGSRQCSSVFHRQRCPCLSDTFVEIGVPDIMDGCSCGVSFDDGAATVASRQSLK